MWSGVVVTELVGDLVATIPAAGTWWRAQIWGEYSDVGWDQRCAGCHSCCLSGTWRGTGWHGPIPQVGFVPEGTFPKF